MPSLRDLWWNEKDRNRLPTAVVVTLSSLGTVDLQWRGTVVPGVPYLASYSPTAGDVVAVIVPVPGSLLVLGKLGTGVGGLGPNLLPNPSFELGLNGHVPSSWSDFWSASSGHEVMDNTVAHTGGASAVFNVGAVAAGDQSLIVGAISVDPGATYRVGAWFKANVVDASHATVRVSIITAATDAGAQPFGAGSTTVDVASTSPTKSWVEAAGTRVIPATDYYARVLVHAATSSGFTVAQIWCDDVSLRHQ